MKNYLVTYYWQNDVNNSVSVALRTKLEKVSPEKWIQLFPNQLALQTELTISELYKELLPESEKIRISIVEFENIFSNEVRVNSLAEKYGFPAVKN